MDQNCHVTVIDKSPSIEERQTQAEVRLEISGMGCPNCVHRVRNSLLLSYGVTSVDIRLENGAGTILYNPDLIQPGDLLRAVVAAGGDGRHEYRARLLG